MMKYKTSVKNWEGLAQNDALWSILTDSSKKGEKWNPEDFFKSGQIEVDTSLKILRDNQIEILVVVLADYQEHLQNTFHG